MRKLFLTKVTYCPTNGMTADYMMKPLEGEKFISEENRRFEKSFYTSYLGHRQD